MQVIILFLLSKNLLIYRNVDVDNAVKGSHYYRTGYSFHVLRVIVSCSNLFVSMWSSVIKSPKLAVRIWSALLECDLR